MYSSNSNSNSNHQNEKPIYIGLTGIKSSSPPPPIGTPPTTDEGFAYSTLLRRAEDETLLRGKPFHARLPSPTTSTFPTNKTYHPITSSNQEECSTSASLYASATPSAHYSIQSIDQVVQQFNTHPVDARESVLKKFLAQFYESPLNLLLLGSAAVSYLVGNTDDAISITAAIVIVVTVGFIQERRSEKSLAALNKLVPHYCHLTRDGQPQTLLANVLVPGDLVTFSVGDRIPADLRLIKANQLEIDESSMTGETKPMKKQIEAVQIEGLRLPDISERTNVALMGTLVKNGNGAGIVVGTGSQTEFGVVFGMMQEVEERKTPLQLSMDELATKLSAISFAVIAVICLIGLWQKRSWLEMFTVGVSLAVAAIPEGLPIVVTVTLALGVLRMSKRKAIVKKLHSVETLGSVSVIYVILKTLQIANLCVNAYRNQDGTNVGTSTEVALLNILTILGIEDCRPQFNRKSETPFTSEAKYSSVVGTFKPSQPPISSPPESSRSIQQQPRQQSTIMDSDTHYLIGAPEIVLSKCKLYLKSDSVTTGLDDDLVGGSTRNKIILEAEAMAKTGLRVLAMAYGFDSNNMIFTGLQGMTDPPRKGVSQAIASLQKGGVHVVMITGDSEFTATAISRELGILTNAGISSCLTGQEIDRLTPRQLIDRVKGTSVFARVTPRHKMSIIEAFQSTGSVVAMTGDGVNDAPALRMADIGISMGKGATDVAKEAADLILVDDNFSTILPAIEEGKTIFYNIQNFLAFQLSTAVAALSLITISTILGLPAPLNAMQILFINILMDGPPSQSLGVDPVNKEVMKRKPRSKHSSVLTMRLLYRIGFSAIMIISCTLFIYLFDLKGIEAGQRDQTVTFTSFVFLDLISAIQNRGLNVDLIPRSIKRSIKGFFQFKLLGFFNRGSRKIYQPVNQHHHHLTNRIEQHQIKTHNPILLLTVLFSFLSLLGIIYLPVLQKIFQTQNLNQRDLKLLFI
ncbi:hypothetical protein PSTT_05071 [Puccinia striiformis]|uniref:P-type Ca(2+) transporter n=1 Tax=Puccinia striiformis TaxID=27350 RepID=A0A2S4VQC3_9BASI|nr:hypothetical protein PSTT_05071 [Puccinia striiformis]